MELGEVVSKLFYYQLHLKVYHWQTRSAPRHRASEDLLGKVQSFTDDLVEMCQGRYEKRIFFEKQKIALRNMVEDGEDYGYALLRELCKMIEEFECDDEAVENKRQELLGEVERSLYLFTLQ
jgi:hypothetical protein